MDKQRGGDWRTILPGAAGLGACRRLRGRQAGSGGLGSMLDLNGDGNPLDDILRMAKGASANRGVPGNR